MKARKGESNYMPIGSILKDRQIAHDGEIVKSWVCVISWYDERIPFCIGWCKMGITVKAKRDFAWTCIGWKVFDAGAEG
jgi:hypothetical protein